MSSMALDRQAVIVGVDTHKDEHYAVALDGLGARLGGFVLAADPTGYTALLNWVHQFGSRFRFGRGLVRTASVSPDFYAVTAKRSSRSADHPAKVSDVGTARAT